MLKALEEGVERVWGVYSVYEYGNPVSTDDVEITCWGGSMEEKERREWLV